MLYVRSDIKDWKALIKEGNIIKIRQWDDMEEEYGVGISSINCECMFTNNMRSLCGSEIKINEKMVEDFKKYGYFFNDSKGYSISTDMIESIKTTDDIIIKDMVTFIPDDKKEEIIKRLEKALNFDREFYGKMKTIPLVYFTKTVQDELQEDCVTYMLIETVKNL